MRELTILPPKSLSIYLQFYRVSLYILFIMDQHYESQPLRELRIKWPKFDVTVTVRMNELNSALVDILWDTLPYRSLQTHALVTGDQLYHLVPAEPLLVCHC